MQPKGRRIFALKDSIRHLSILNILQTSKAHWIVPVTAIVVLVSIGIVFWQGTQYQTIASVVSPTANSDVVDEPIQPIPLHIDLDQNKVALGRKLFFEPMLSSNNTISCSSCHVLDKGGVDHLRVGIGINGSAGVINVPTVYNVGFNFRQFWDGRAATLAGL